MKNKNMKRLFAGLLCFAMVLPMAACGKAEENKEEGKETTSSVVEESTEEKEEVSAEPEEWPTITVAVPDREGTNYGEDNLHVQWLEENCQVNIEWFTLPSDGAECDSKLNLMFVNGDYPDVICGVAFDKVRMLQLGEEGILIPLNEYYEKDSIYLKELFEYNPDYYNLSLAPDGNMYGILTPQECYHCTAYSKVFYNIDWLESLGMEVPTTTEELKDLLIAVKNSDYNGNGVADEIPITGTYKDNWGIPSTMLNYFLPYNRASLAYAKDGEVVFAPDREEFKMGLEYIKDLYQEGLIDPAIFTQDYAQLGATVTQDEGKTTFAHVVPYYGAATPLDDKEGWMNTGLMTPVSSDVCPGYQQETAFVDQSAIFRYVITDNCENPEAAFRLGDFLLSGDATTNNYYGLEGYAWEKLETEIPAEKEGMVCKYKILTVEDEETKTFIADNKFTVDHFNGALYVRGWQGEFNLLDENNAYTPIAHGYHLNKYTDVLDDYFYPEYLIQKPFFADEETRTKFNDMRVSMQDYVTKSIAQFVTGEKDLNKDWDSYVSDLKNYGSEEYTRLYQEAYDAFLRK